MGTGVIKYDEMIRAVSECHAIDEIKDWRDKAKALEAYASQANNIEAERKAIEIRLRAERKCGELLRDMDKAKGSRGKIQEHTGGQVTRPPDNTKTLSEMNISKDQSSKFQKLAEIPEEDFEAALANQQTERPSTALLINQFAPKAKSEVPKLSISLWGWASDACASEVFNHDPNDLIEDMTVTMRIRFFESLPLIINYINQIEVSKWEEKNTA